MRNKKQKQTADFKRRRDASLKELEKRLQKVPAGPFPTSVFTAVCQTCSHPALQAYLSSSSPGAIVNSLVFFSKPQFFQPRVLGLVDQQGRHEGGRSVARSGEGEALPQQSTPGEHRKSNLQQHSEKGPWHLESPIAKEASVKSPPPNAEPGLEKTKGSVHRCLADQTRPASIQRRLLLATRRILSAPRGFSEFLLLSRILKAKARTTEAYPMAAEVKRICTPVWSIKYSSEKTNVGNLSTEKTDVNSRAERN